MGGKNVFSVPIFFVLFRETVEAGIVVSCLLSLVDQLAPVDSKDQDAVVVQKKLRKRMRWMVWAGSLTGLAITICIGAAFIAVFFTQLSDLWAKSEDLYEGIFCLIAAILIFFMSLGMLKIDRSQIKWKHKFAAAFNKDENATVTEHERRQGRRGKWGLFILPMVTILREGLEAVTFVGGVSLGQPAKSIPLAAIMGILVGFVIGFIIYRFGTRVNMTIFLVVSTNVLLLLGAGLFSRSVWFLEAYQFHKGVGSDVSETGSGPGSFDVDGLVWHVPYGSPENQLSSQGWSIFNAILGWQNTATLGSVLSYCFYWIAFIFALVRMKWIEGRTSIFGIESAAGKRRLVKKKQEEASVETLQGDEDEKLSSKAGSSQEKLDETVEGLSTRPVFRREDTSAHERDIVEIHEA
ncbi:hypothetical protein JCM3765_006496 [Sporobolomyces pararoseus]